MFETLDFTIRIGSTPTVLYFDLYLYSAYTAHYVYFTKNSCDSVRKKTICFTPPNPLPVPILWHAFLLIRVATYSNFHTPSNKITLLQVVCRIVCFPFVRDARAHFWSQFVSLKPFWAIVGPINTCVHNFTVFVKFL